MTCDSRIALIAACMCHVEGTYSTKSVGFYHRNPGNIMMKEGDKYSLKTYPNQQAGWEALLHDLEIKRSRHMTLAEVIHMYAPPVENDTESYVKIVSTLTGIKPDEKI